MLSEEFPPRRSSDSLVPQGIPRNTGAQCERPAKDRKVPTSPPAYCADGDATVVVTAARVLVAREKAALDDEVRDGLRVSAGRSVGVAVSLRVGCDED